MPNPGQAVVRGDNGKRRPRVKFFGKLCIACSNVRSSLFRPCRWPGVCVRSACYFIRPPGIIVWDSRSLSAHFGMVALSSLAVVPWVTVCKLSDLEAFQCEQLVALSSPPLALGIWKLVGDCKSDGGLVYQTRCLWEQLHYRS